MKIKINKLYWAYQAEIHLPRKVKKYFIGKRMSKKDLNELLNSVNIVKPTNGQDSAIIEPYPFCPKCGCRQTRFVDMGAEYPERWHHSYCVRCKKLVEASDNSPYYHALEMEDYTL